MLGRGETLNPVRFGSGDSGDVKDSSRVPDQPVREYALHTREELRVSGVSQKL